MSTRKKTTSSRKKTPPKGKTTPKDAVIEGVAEEVVSEDVTEAASEVVTEAVPKTQKEAAPIAEPGADNGAGRVADGEESLPDSSGEEPEEVIEEIIVEVDHGGRAGWYAAAALAFFIGGAGTLAYTAPWLSQNLPEGLAKYVRPAGEAVEARLSALEGSFGALEGSVATLGEAVETSPGDLSVALAARLDKFEGRLDVLGQQTAEPSALKEEIKALQAAVARNADAAKAVDITPVLARLGQIESALKVASEEGGGSAAALAAVTAEVAALGTQIKALEPQIEAVRREAETIAAEKLAVAEQKSALLAARIGVLENDDSGKAASRAIAMAGLSSAVRRGNFSAELETFRTLSPDAMATPALDRLAVAGLPSIPSLQSGYQAALRSALAAEKAPGDNASWSDKLFGNALNVVSVRPVGEVGGTSTPAILARGEVRVEAGEIAAALTELESLTGPAKAAMAGWIGTARARTAALAELDMLRQSSLAAMSGTTN